MGIDFKPSNQTVREAAVQNRVTLAGEEALEAQFARIDALIGLEVERLSAEIRIAIERQPAALPGNVEAAGVLWPVEEFLSYAERRLDQRRAIQGEYSRIDKGIFSGHLQRAGGALADRGLEALSPRISEVVRDEGAEVRE